MYRAVKTKESSIGKQRRRGSGGRGRGRGEGEEGEINKIKLKNLKYYTFHFKPQRALELLHRWLPRTMNNLSTGLQNVFIEYRRHVDEQSDTVIQTMYVI